MLYEREAELEAVHASLARAAGGNGRLVVVEGGSGAGKTALLDAVVDLGVDAGFTVLAARATPFEHGFPFGVALQILEPPVHQATPADQAVLLSGPARPARPLLHLDVPDPDDLSFQDNEHTLVHGLHWLTVGLSKTAPLLIVVDDAHWADPGSLHYLLHLGARVSSMPAVVVISLRSGHVDHEGGVIAALRAQSRARVFELEPLSVDAITRLVRSTYFRDATDELCRRLHDLTEGNPFLVTEYLAALDLEDQELGVDSLRRLEHTAPSSIRRATQGRLASVSDEARCLAHVVATLGDDARLSIVAPLVEVDLSAVPRVVQELVSADILEWTEPLRFTHPSMHAAVVASTPMAERQDLHRRAARLLAATGTPMERVAAHLRSTSASADDWVAATMWATGSRSLRAGQADDAVGWLRRALEEPPPADVRADLLVDLGTAETVVGDEAAVVHLNEAVSLMRSRTQRATALQDAGIALWSFGHQSDAVRAFERALREVPSDCEDLRLSLEATYAWAGRLDRNVCARTAPRLRDIRSQAANRASVPASMALAELALEEAIAGSPPSEVRELVDRVVGGRVADRNVAVISAAAAALVTIDELADAEDLLSDAIELADRAGSPLHAAAAQVRRAFSRCQRGALAGAIDDAERVRTGARHAVKPFLPGAVATLSTAHLARGEMPKAAAVLDDDCLHDDDNNALFLRVSEARGWLALAVGDPAQALAEAAHIGRQEGGVPWVGHPGLMSWRPIAALALARIDRRNEAVEYAADEVQRARDVGAARSLAAALRVRGQLEGRGGVTMLEEAVAVAEQSSSLLERAACAIELGAALRRTNRRAAALDVLRSGLDLAYRCEAHPIADRARHEIAVCGGRPRRTALTGPSALTPSEVRVAQLAASGMTNREIAEHLVVSLKAVEWHLRNTFAKLDITTRRDLAAALHESKAAEDTA